MTELFKRTLYLNDHPVASHYARWGWDTLDSLVCGNQDLGFTDSTFKNDICVAIHRRMRNVQLKFWCNEWTFTKMGGLLSYLYPLYVTPQMVRKLDTLTIDTKFKVSDRLVYCCETQHGVHHPLEPRAALDKAMALGKEVQIDTL